MTAITKRLSWRIDALERASELSRVREDVDLLRVPGLRRHPRYMVCFAASKRALSEVQQLRFALGDGHAVSWERRIHGDLFDAQMTHLVLVERATGAVVGACRLQTWKQARARRGFASEQRFDLQPLAHLLPDAAEVGRPCLRPEHHNPAAIDRLCRGLRGFLTLHGLRYLFGSCSLTTSEPREGWRLMRTLEGLGWTDAELRCPPRASHACGPDPADQEALPLPGLFHGCGRLGARAVSDPAIDREQGAVRILMLIDMTTATLRGLRGTGE